MGQGSEISTRLKRLRKRMASGEAAPAGHEVELLMRLADVERLVAEWNEAELFADASHPLGHAPAETAWALFQLDRCETLLEEATPANVSFRTKLDDVLQLRLSDVLFRRCMAAVLMLRGRWRREPVECHAPSLREVLYLRLPGLLAWVIGPCLPRRGRVEAPRPRQSEALPVPNTVAYSGPHYARQEKDSRPERMETV